MERSSSKDHTPGTSAKSKLKHPLRSATKPAKEKPLPSNSLNSSTSKREKPVSSLAKSVGALDSSTKDSTSKPPRRLSVPAKSGNVTKAVGSSTPVSERKTTRPSPSVTPLPGAAKSSSRRKFSLLSSASYWLSQIKLFESAGKHSISLGFFKLALEAEMETFHRHQMRDELKSYVIKHKNLEVHDDLLNHLFKSYEISENWEELGSSEGCSKGLKPKSLNINQETPASKGVEAGKNNSRVGTPVSRVRNSVAKSKAASGVKKGNTKNGEIDNQGHDVSADPSLEENKENVDVGFAEAAC